MRQACCHARKGAGGIKMCNLAPVSRNGCRAPISCTHAGFATSCHLYSLMGLAEGKTPPPAIFCAGGREERTQHACDTPALRGAIPQTAAASVHVRRHARARNGFRERTSSFDANTMVDERGREQARTTVVLRGRLHANADKAAETISSVDVSHKSPVCVAPP